jgi:hypothetical protein
MTMRIDIGAGWGSPVSAGPFFDAPDDGGGSAPSGETAGAGGAAADLSVPDKREGDDGGGSSARAPADLLELDKGEAGSVPAEADLLELDKGGAGGQGKGTDAGASKDGAAAEPPAAEPLTAEALELPDGFEFDPESGKSFLDALNDTKLSRKELAQKMIGLHAATMDKFVGEIIADRKKKTHEWADAARKDAEYGGDRFNANIPVIGRGRDAIATPATLAAIRELGLAAHPEILRMFYRAGRLCEEDSSLTPGAAPRTDIAQAMFGKSLEGVRISVADAEDFV